MKIKYFEDTDTALLELGGGAPTETRDLSQDIALDLDESGHVVSITTEHRHVVRQGQKRDRSDFFMLLLEAGTFDSPRTPAAASGAGFGGA